MNIYVGNLSYDTGDEDLRQAFEAFGRVDSARVISDRMTGRSRGFGFVEMSDDAEARAAIEKMDGQDLQGRAPSRERSPAERRARTFPRRIFPLTTRNPRLGDAPRGSPRAVSTWVRLRYSRGSSVA